MPDTVSFTIEPRTAVFTIDADTPAGPFTLEPHAEHVVHLTFQPVEVRTAHAVAFVQLTSQCPRVLVNVSGTGASPLDLVKPLTMDVGWAPAGATRSSFVDFASIVGHPVRLSSATARTSETALFSLALPQTAPPSGFDDFSQVEVPGVVSVPLTFVPPQEGDFVASYLVATDLPTLPLVQVDVTAHGGAPDVFLPVTQLMLGPDAGAFASFEVRNVGTLPSSPDPRVSLHFGSPPWEVRAPPGASPDELCVGLMPGLCEVPAEVPELTSGDSLRVFLSAPPSASGPRRFQLVLHVDDPDEPTPTVDVWLP